MIENLVILGVGIFLGAVLAVSIISLCAIRSVRPRKIKSKDDWRELQ